MEHLDSNCPLISLRGEIAENIPAVLCDNYQGGILAANRLFDAGCRNIAILTAYQGKYPAYSREKAFMKCCEDKKISGRVVYTDRLAPLSEEFGNNILELLKKNSNLDGIFATSDVMAANIIRACKKWENVFRRISLLWDSMIPDFHIDVSFHHDHSSAGAGNV